MTLFLKTVAIIFASLFAISCGEQKCLNNLSGWETENEMEPHQLIKNQVSINGERIYWNGVQSDLETVVRYTKKTRESNPQPVLSLRFAKNVNCSRKQEVRKLLHDAYFCNSVSFCEEVESR